MAKLARLLNLTAALLNTEVPLTSNEIQARVPGYPDGSQAFHRAFERDKDDLRELGVPIDTVVVSHLEQPRSAYTIDYDQYALADPQLSPEELAALHLASSAVHLEGLDPDDAEDALRKLGGFPTGTPAAATTIGTLPVSTELIGLFGATVERREATFEYGDTGRRLQPHRLQFERGHWYVSGHDVDRDAPRSFRVDRIMGGVTTGDPGAFERPASARGVLTNPWELGDEPAVPTLVLIDREPAQATLSEYPDLEVSRRLGDGSVEVRLSVRNKLGLWHFMVNLLDRAEILEPPEMREGLVEWLARFDERDLP